MAGEDYQELATYKTHAERVKANWPDFLQRREEMLMQVGRFGGAPEKAAETIMGTLLTDVLDWQTRDLNWQLSYADLVVTRNIFKCLLVETKAPGTFVNSRTSIMRAFEQAHRYAAEQKVKAVVVSDGLILRVADVANGGLEFRCATALDVLKPPIEPLWWISVHGIYRPVPETITGNLYDPLWKQKLPDEAKDPNQAGEAEELLHHKYKIPARCFAYVPDASDPKSWKLPYRLIDSKPDTKRLPKAIQSLLSNYRGTQVSGIPDEVIPAVMRRLEAAAREVGKMPDQLATTARTYQRLQEALAQLR